MDSLTVIKHSNSLAYVESRRLDLRMSIVKGFAILAVGTFRVTSLTLGSQYRGLKSESFGHVDSK